MTTIREQVTIQAPLEVVAAYVSDPAHLPEWNKIIVRVLDVRPTPEGVGTTWQVVVNVMGREQQITARINLHDPPARFGLELVGGAPGLPSLTANMLVEAQSIPPANGTDPAPATHLSCTLEVRLPLLAGGAVLGAVVAPLIKEQLLQGLNDLKRILETRPASPI